jgi:hypothetical protein
VRDRLFQRGLRLVRRVGPVSRAAAERLVATILEAMGRRTGRIEELVERTRAGLAEVGQSAVERAAALGGHAEALAGAVETDLTGTMTEAAQAATAVAQRAAEAGVAATIAATSAWVPGRGCSQTLPAMLATTQSRRRASSTGPGDDRRQVSPVGAHRTGASRPTDAASLPDRTLMRAAGPRDAAHTRARATRDWAGGAGPGEDARMRSYEIEALEAGKGHAAAREEADLESPDLAARAAVAGRTEVLAPAAVMRLQRAAGNAGVAAALEGEQEQDSPVKDVIGKPACRAPVGSGWRRPSGPTSPTSGCTRAGPRRRRRRPLAPTPTVRNEIVLGDGHTPGSTGHERTLAHELTHVVQQRSGPVDGTPTGGGISVSDPSDRFEQAAEATADTVISSGRAPDAGAVGGGGASVQRQEMPEEELQALAVQRARDARGGGGSRRSPSSARRTRKKKSSLHRARREPLRGRRPP